MKQIKKSTLLTLFSVIVFTVTTALTIVPAADENTAPLLNPCYSCTPEGPCVQANWCGMSQCAGDCDLTGVYCETGGCDIDIK